MTGYATAGPSLALIKYWGKASTNENTPATGSLAVTLKELQTATEVTFDDRDSVVLDGREQPLVRFGPILKTLRSAFPLEDRGLRIVSTNNFPTAAGLASSSSGFAALVGAVDALVGTNLPLEELSALARRGSGSATRSLFPGFTVFEAGALQAEPLYGADYWPDFCVVIAVVEEAPKPRSSRDAMESSRTSSPYYNEWVLTSPPLLARAKLELSRRDWSGLGPAIRQSYLRMFATMFTSEPPLLYWQPTSLALLHTLEALRLEGFSAWETMDAGPQVKIFCPRSEADALVVELQRRCPGPAYLVASPGPGLQRESRR